MEILFIGIIFILVWLGRTLHNIRGSDQEESDKKRRKIRGREHSCPK